MVYRLAYKCYRLPLRQPLRTAHDILKEREGIILQVETEDGAKRYGEVATLSWFGTETIEESAAALDSLGSRFERTAIDAFGMRFSCARFALSCAMAVDAPTTFQTRANTCLLPAGRAVLERLKLSLEDGWLAFKWKVGVGDIADELAIFDDLFAILPEHTKLRLDANGGWTTRQAARWLERCAERPVEFVEQPVPPTDIDALCGLANDYPTVLALDESISTPLSLQEWIGRGWSGVYVIKPSIGGPPEELLETLEKARADAVFSTALETSIGMRAALHVALRYQNRINRALGFGVGPLFADSRFNLELQTPLIDPSILNHDRSEVIWNSL